ncbi:hypothetical protein Tco_1382029, partial [Tanacetum coccineum]
ILVPPIHISKAQKVFSSTPIRVIIDQPMRQAFSKPERSRSLDVQDEPLVITLVPDVDMEIYAKEKDWENERDVWTLFTDGAFRCVGPLQANYVIKEIDIGSYGMYSSHSVAASKDEHDINHGTMAFLSMGNKHCRASTRSPEEGQVHPYCYRLFYEVD